MTAKLRERGRRHLRQHLVTEYKAIRGTATVSQEVEEARQSIEAFTLYTYPQYQANWHHSVMFDYLDRMINGDITRLMIFAPPRHGKSEIVSRRLPAYILGRNPNAKIISASYGADLARRMNRDVQRIIDSNPYRKVFPGTSLHGSNVRAVAQGTYLRNSDVFEVVGHEGYYRSAGVGGAITGMGMDFGIIDDPYKNRQDASSQTVRETIKSWYASTFRTRLAPNGRILVTLTRWHEMDIASFLLNLQEVDEHADKWTVLSFPAVYENERPFTYDQRQEGESLWPDRFGLDELAKARASLGTYEWSALYQQRPAPREGGMFKLSWFQIVEALPASCRFARYWDKAGTEGAGDYTAGVLLAVSPAGVYYVVDLVMGQWSAVNREKIITQTLLLDRQAYGYVQTFTEQEPGSGGKESADATIRNNPGFYIKSDRPTGDKEIRAEPYAAQCEAGNVKLLNGAWNGRYLEIVTSFPNGIKDPVDASSGAFSRLVETGSASWANVADLGEVKEFSGNRWT